MKDAPLTEIVRLADPETIAQEAAKRWVEIARAAAAQRGEFTIALSGGKTPTRLYELMASAPHKDNTPWEQTFVFWGDERRVPASHDDSNFRMARESLLNHVPVPALQTFPMLGQGLASSAVRDYEEKLRGHFKLQRGEWPRFDLMLLGMGQDGHIASIFPGTRAASDLSNMVVVYEVPQIRKERITLTRPVFSHARNLLYLVSGNDKAAAVAATLQGVNVPSTYPAQGLMPQPDTRVVWLLDKAAASRLKKS